MYIKLVVLSVEFPPLKRNRCASLVQASFVLPCLILRCLASFHLAPPRHHFAVICCIVLSFPPHFPLVQCPDGAYPPNPLHTKWPLLSLNHKTPHHLVCCKSMPAIPGWMFCQQAVPGWALHTNFLACIVPANMHLNSAWCFSQRSYRPSAQAPHVI